MVRRGLQLTVRAMAVILHTFFAQCAPQNRVRPSK
jgi:hypothetical protein